MTTGSIELITLHADEGKVLTNGEAYSSPGGSVFLGVGDNPENWREITEEEYAEAMAARYD